MKHLIIAICDTIGLICASVSIFITGVIVQSIIIMDPRITDNPDFKRIFLGVLCPLIVTLTCAGIRSLYNEKET